jgi:hypothetical protein
LHVIVGLRSPVAQVILAGLRIVFFLPYIWQYRNDKRMLHPTLPLLWQLANLCVIAAKTVNYIYQHENSSAQWSLVALSAVSVVCQVTLQLRTCAPTDCWTGWKLIECSADPCADDLRQPLEELRGARAARCHRRLPWETAAGTVSNAAICLRLGL